MAVDTTSNVYVDDFLNRRIREFDNKDAFPALLGTRGSGMRRPQIKLPTLPTLFLTLA